MTKTSPNPGFSRPPMPAPRMHDAGGPAGRHSPRSLLGTAQTGPARWVLAFAVFLAVMGASLGLAGVLRDLRWLPQAAVVVAGTLLIPALMRRYLVLSPLAPLGALAGWFMAMTLVFFPGTSILGVIPTTGTVAAALEMANDASHVVMGSLAPAPSVPSMHFVFSAGLGFAALLVDTLAITVATPAASFLGLALVLLPAALTTRTGIGTSGFVGTAAGYLLILGCARWYAPDGKLRTDTPKVASGVLIKATALGAAVVLLMTMLTQAIPGFNQGAYPQGASLSGTGTGGSLDPMLTLGDDLRSQSARVSMRYQSSAQVPQYMRLATLENFSGKVWEPSPLPQGLQAKLSGLSPADGPAPNIPRARTETRITVPGAGDEWLPAPLSATDVQQLPGVWLWNPITQTIYSQTTTTAGRSYVVRSEMPVLTPELLNGATAPPRPGLDPVFTELPQDVPDIVSRTAQEVTAGEATPYAKAMAIQDYLRSDAFSYSLSTPVAEGYDGSGMGVLADFLEQKSGYCVHFSAAMAVMAREEGIPSRIAVGYTSGTRAPQLDGPDTSGATPMRGYEISGRDAHAWPELYFEGLGWVPFEPTPSRGYVPNYAQDEFVPAPAPEANPVNTAQATATATTAAPTNSAKAAAGTDEAPLDTARFLAGTGWLLLAVFLLASPALLRLAVRRRRLALVRGGGPGAEPDRLAWREVLATAVDLGYVVDPALTPALQARAVADFMAGSYAPAGSTGPDRPMPAGLELLLHSYEQAIYGAGAAGDAAPGREDLAEAAETLVARFQSAAAPGQRWRATLLPASFLRSRHLG